MSALSRRAFLAGSAATVAGPALAASAGEADFDILIIGAGVAGIAAAKRVAATGMKCLVLEAGDHLGARAVQRFVTLALLFDENQNFVRFRP